jgi:NDP-sugar pyrophosphorylase family protein
MIHQAVVLCAGLGTRLRPFTDSAPKPMLPILGIPMIEWNLRRFLEYGVNQFFINLHYLPEPLVRHVGDGSQWGARVAYHYEPQILGTAGGLKSFEEQLEDEFFVIYGDIFSRVNYSVMESEWRERNNGIGMQRVRMAQNNVDADVVELDALCRVVAVHPKPHSQVYRNAYRMAGVFIMRREILSATPKDTYSEIGKDMIPTILKMGRNFFGYLCDDYSKGIDTLEKQTEVESYLLQREIKLM